MNILECIIVANVAITLVAIIGMETGTKPPSGFVIFGIYLCILGAIVGGDVYYLSVKHGVR